MAIYTHIATTAEGFHDKLDLSRIEPIRNRNFVKPHGGFWLSIDGDWERWCSDEMPGWLEGDRYAVKLRDDARVITIKTEADLAPLPKQIPEQFTGMPAELLAFVLSDNCFLDFEEISRHYDVIDVYAGSDEGLYQALYGWDCDSALVLNPGVIQAVYEVPAWSEGEEYFVDFKKLEEFLDRCV